MSSTEVEEQLPTLARGFNRGVPHYVPAFPEEDMKDDGTPMSWKEEPKLFLCDNWIMPVEVMKKPSPLWQPQDRLRARVARTVKGG